MVGHRLTQAQKIFSLVALNGGPDDLTDDSRRVHGMVVRGVGGIAVL